VICAVTQLAKGRRQTHKAQVPVAELWYKCTHWLMYCTLRLGAPLATGDITKHKCQVQMRAILVLTGEQGTQ
jgi:hypothetical protein